MEGITQRSTCFNEVHALPRSTEYALQLTPIPPNTQVLGDGNQCCLTQELHRREGFTPGLHDHGRRHGPILPQVQPVEGPFSPPDLHGLGSDFGESLWRVGNQEVRKLEVETLEVETGMVIQCPVEDQKQRAGVETKSRDRKQRPKGKDQEQRPRVETKSGNQEWRPEDGNWKQEPEVETRSR